MAQMDADERQGIVASATQPRLIPLSRLRPSADALSCV